MERCNAGHQAWLFTVFRGLSSPLPRSSSPLSDFGKLSITNRVQLPHDHPDGNSDDIRMLPEIMGCPCIPYISGSASSATAERRGFLLSFSDRTTSCRGHAMPIAGSAQNKPYSSPGA